MKIKVMPQNIEIEGDPNKTLLQICSENHVEINSICKGVPKCAECRVKILEGESYVIPPSATELNLIGTSYYLDQRRLSCQVRSFGPLTIDVTEQIERSEVQNKKVRGFKAHDQKTESHALQGTMVLEEKDEGPRGGGNGEEPREPNRQPRQQQRNQGRR